MTDDTLKKANELKREIDGLNFFIQYAEMCWSHLSFLERLKKGKPLISYKGYGAFSGGVYEIPDDLSKKILELMKQYKDEKWEEYRNLN